MSQLGLTALLGTRTATYLRHLPGYPKATQYVGCIDRCLGDDLILVVSRIDGEISEVWPTEDPAAEFKYKPPDEMLEFRLWSGIVAEFEPSG